MEIGLQAFLSNICDQLGDIEASRVEKLFTARGIKQFTFHVGIKSVKDLYDLDLREITE